MKIELLFVLTSAAFFLKSVSFLALSLGGQIFLQLFLVLVNNYKYHHSNLESNLCNIFNKNYKQFGREKNSQGIMRYTLYTLTKNISRKEIITNWPKRGLRGWGSVTGKDELTRVSDDSEFERILDEYQLGGTSDKTNFVSPINFHIPGILIEKQNLMNENIPSQCNALPLASG